jgi:hypothetical protein
MKASVQKQSGSHKSQDGEGAEPRVPPHHAEPKAPPKCRELGEATAGDEKKK